MLATVTQGVPTAHISVNGNRVKHYRDKDYNDKVYLPDGAHFQIELFNPKQTSVLVKIKLNGQYISDSGLILRPGEHYYLDRFLDKQQKFKFSTYEVEGSKEAMNAIAKNGEVEVEFYEQTTLTGGTTWFPGNTTTIWTNGTGGNQWSNGFYNINSAGGNFTLTSGVSGNIGLTGPVGNQGPEGPAGVPSSDNACYFSCSVNNIEFEKPKAEEPKVETGRVTEGEKSDQSFTHVNESYNSWTCALTTIQILPNSRKPVEKKEIRSYCTGCGTRMKKGSWNYCPTCGTKRED